MEGSLYSPFNAGEYFIAVCFAVVGFGGFFLNGFIINLLIKNRTMRSISNILLICMICGDFIYAIRAIVNNVSNLANGGSWSTGQIGCNVDAFLVIYTAGFSQMIFTYMAIERFFKIVRNKDFSWEIYAVAVILILSFLVLLAGAPVFFLDGFAVQPSKAFCLMRVDTGERIPWVVYALSVMGYMVVCISLVCYCYYRIFRHLRQISAALKSVNAAKPKETRKMSIASGGPNKSLTNSIVQPHDSEKGKDVKPRKESVAITDVTFSPGSAEKNNELTQATISADTNQSPNSPSPNDSGNGGRKYSIRLPRFSFSGASMPDGSPRRMSAILDDGFLKKFGLGKFTELWTSLSEKERKPLLRSLILVVCFLGAWSPSFLRFIFETAYGHPSPMGLDAFCSLCALSDCVINPIIIINMDSRCNACAKGAMKNILAFPKFIVAKITRQA